MARKKGNSTKKFPHKKERKKIKLFNFSNLVSLEVYNLFVLKLVIL